MRAFLTTVAGMSTRFSESLGRQVLKCIYYENDPEKTLLRYQMDLAKDYDVIVIVGGFLFDQLRQYIADYLPEAIKAKIKLVYNEEYNRLASGWSLYVGLRALEKEKPDSILFAEGDIYVDSMSFRQIESCQGDAITINDDTIEAKKSVVLYVTEDDRPHYIYDANHGMLYIPEPFRCIYNSAQIWKIDDTARLFALMNQIPEDHYEKTNLSLIDPYYSQLQMSRIHILPIRVWVNCNTVQDFQKISKLSKKEKLLWN